MSVSADKPSKQQLKCVQRSKEIMFKWVKGSMMKMHYKVENGNKEIKIIKITKWKFWT